MKMITYHRIWLGGNTTALVTARLPRKKYPLLANRIIKADPEIEQVGFIERPSVEGAVARLQMMGGEFCGNATRGAGYFLALGMVPGLVSGKRKKIVMESSGYDRPLTVEIKGNTSRLVLPGDFLVAATEITEGRRIDLKGISHIISAVEGESGRKTLVKKYGKKCEALGVIGVAGKGKKLRIRPFIWVRQTNTFIAETGCASGSIAAAIAANGGKTPVKGKIIVRQPSGADYEVTLKTERGRLREISLDGPAEIRGVGSVEGRL